MFIYNDIINSLQINYAGYYYSTQTSETAVYMIAITTSRLDDYSCKLI